MGIRPTLFVVGRELENGSAVDYLNEAAKLGFEVGNHSYGHLYNLSLLTEREIQDEIIRGEKIISDKLGFKPVGFRSPGYNVSRNIFNVLVRRGYKYDSSILPSPFYYFAKCGVILFYRLTGRKTRSICGSVKMPFASRKAYLTDENTIYSVSNERKIAEIPISVTGIFGIPYVGTFIMGYREVVYRYLLRRSRSLSLLHIELHGIDFIDRSDIDDERLCRSQFDLNIPIERKLGRLREIITAFDPDESVRLSDITLL